MVVGGTGGTGGDGGGTCAANLGNGTVTTLKAHAPGVVMQSVGGGRGNGGVGYGQSYSLFYGASVAVGGTGGVGRRRLDRERHRG